MKKNWSIIAIIFLLLLIICFLIYSFTNRKKNINNYETSRVSDIKNVQNNTINETTDSINFNQNDISNENKTEAIQNEINNNSTDESAKNEQNDKKEETISSFSTTIYTKDSSRQNNITITCSNLTNTIIPNGSTFSFCNTIGPSTTEKGYQKADIFDKYGNKKKGLGGGNCQVSTTLYNAVLKIPNLLSVTERHEHSNKVPYIEKGKDAAVAYGSYDLKFKNNSGSDIKIIAENSPDTITISINKIF